MVAYFRYFIRLTQAYIKRFKGIIIIGVVLGGILSTLFIFFSPALTRAKSERIAIAGRYYSENLPSSVVSLISDGLTHVDENGIVEPALAESWETPDKGKTWIFRLKKDMKWQDGTPITSNTIQYEFADVDIERPDDETIVFKLDQAFSPFPTVVSSPVFKQGLLGMKAWSVKNITATGGFIEKLELVNGQDTKLYRFYPTVERTKLAYKLGEVDTIIELQDPIPFDTWKNTNVSSNADTSQVATIFFNTQDPTLSEKSLRQALAYAIDKNTLIAGNQNALGERAIGNMSPKSWSFNPQVKPYDFDQNRARELIDDLPDEVTKDLSIKLMTSPLLLSAAEKIVNDWRAIGIPATVQISTVTPAEYQAFLTLYDIPKDPDQYPLWHSTQATTNISHYASPRIDKLLEDGRILIDLEERRKVYLDFQRFLLEDLPAVFLYYPKYYTITRK
jgi:peptide/nickel transport system substrate-binding protein